MNNLGEFELWAAISGDFMGIIKKFEKVRKGLFENYVENLGCIFIKFNGL